MIDTFYYSYLDKIFAHINNSDLVLIRMSQQNSCFICVLQTYCSNRKIQATIIYDDIPFSTSFNWALYTYYLYFVIGKANRPLEDIAPFLKNRKSIYDQLYLDDKFIKDKWMVAYIPQPEELVYSEYLFLKNLDYIKLARKCFPLYAKLMKSEKITIKGTRINFAFTYSKNTVFSNFGEHNLPDGEIGVIPDIESTSGTLFFSQVIFHGFIFHNVTLCFQKGKCYFCSYDEDFGFEKILYFDDYSPYIGEFAFGLNPYISKKIGVPIIDEKQMGTYHLALGGVSNASIKPKKSFIHLDMISDLNTPCEIYVDNEMIFQTSRFVDSTLKMINSEYLKRGDVHDFVQKR